MDALNISDPAFAPEALSLPDLWHRRASLSNVEMERIYVLVRAALHGYHPAELRALHEDKEELIAQFIFSRVLRLDPERAESHACAQSAPSSGFALCAYFRRYLIDCLRSASHQRNVSLEVDGMADQIDARAHSIDDPVESALTEHGLDEASVRMASRAFVAALDDADRVILAGTLGAYRDRDGGLKGVADEHGVPSYHYRARKLGVTMKKTALPADYARTKIGQWIGQTLRIDITHENCEVILIVLNLLAIEANV
ncbi:hypothetical protein BTHE68_56660 [Burkholderia sp. THE68]|uniref:hypothetical protein n=1 Tax=Burkholderia sp. THE68 TaxID=758782 RepID=UPI001315E52F|nr:hypothetical protein [Burkholderia sp. THE68]BBU31932.1 hypothetical protein BTHE68_56660 [Burkholderia sp. THE68]